MEHSHAAKMLAEDLSRHIVPLFGFEHGKQRLYGSGFLVSSGKNSYLISAAHVFDWLDRGVELFFHIEPGVRRDLSDKSCLRVNLEGKEGESDRLDVAVYELKDEWPPPYPGVNKHAIPVEILMEKPIPCGNNHAFLVGFPNSWSKPNLKWREVESELFAYKEVIKPVEDYPKLEIYSTKHFAIPFDRQLSSEHRIPSLKGMSGSPIWFVDHDNPPKSPTQIPVAGIFIEHHKCANVLIAIYIRFALDMISGTA